MRPALLMYMTQLGAIHYASVAPLSFVSKTSTRKQHFKRGRLLDHSHACIHIELRGHFHANCFVSSLCGTIFKPKMPPRLCVVVCSPTLLGCDLIATRVNLVLVYLQRCREKYVMPSVRRKDFQASHAPAL